MEVLGAKMRLRKHFSPTEFKRKHWSSFCLFYTSIPNKKICFSPWLRKSGSVLMQCLKPTPSGDPGCPWKHLIVLQSADCLLFSPSSSGLVNYKQENLGNSA